MQNDKSMQITVTSVGGSTGIILPQHLLDRLQVAHGDVLEVRETPNGIELTAHKAPEDRQDLILASVMRDHREVLKRLAE